MKKKTSDPGTSKQAGAPVPATPSGTRKGLSLEVPALLAGLMLGAAAALYWAGSSNQQEIDTQAEQLQTQLIARRAELARTQAQLDALSGQLAMEASTRRSLEATLQATQVELGQARDQLAFYDQLLPPGPKGSVSIRALDIERLGPTLQYKVLLMRNARDDAPFKGHMQFVAKGVQQGKQVKITLQPALIPGSPADPVAAAGDAAGPDLIFDQFLRSGGLLSVPEGFTPQAVTLNILEGDTLRVTRTINLPAVD
jgi:multidrug efflux pump subunit AcrA (membrane-fusion protein)